MSVTTLILSIIGVVLLVMLIRGFSLGWGNLWSKINVLGGGGGLDTIVQSCMISSTSDAVLSYCDFKQVTINNAKQYVNCDYGDVKNSLDKQLSCTGVASADMKKFCIGLGKTTKINGQTCTYTPAVIANAAGVTPAVGAKSADCSCA